MANSEQLIIMGYGDGELKGALYEGADYKSILKEFNNDDNLRRYFQLMGIQRDGLKKESKP